MISGEVVWSNATPSSTRYCRPIKFCCAKENPQLIRDEYKIITEKFETLECAVVERKSMVFEVFFQMHCTMIDGAVANVLTNTNSCSRCFICNAKPTEMNNLNTKYIPNVDAYKFGLSSLHCWIRFLECILHIAYRLPFKKWRVGKDNKEEYLATKTRIQRQFRENTGLLIDMVKSGCGTTNDGNTARRFFSDSQLTADITGVDKELIEYFGVILRVLSCGMEINKDTFKELLRITRNKYLILYGWYYMPSSVHKVLIHGSDVINYFELPIGTLNINFFFRKQY